jgi:uncharacterized phage protein (TIGR02218 family)
MAFSLFEISTQGGRPIGLYEFRWGTTVWRYTSADRQITFGLDDQGQPAKWLPVAISDDGVSQGASVTEFEVKLPANLPLVGLFRSTPPAESIWLKVRRFHFGDNDATVIWVGTVGNIKRKGRAEAIAFGLPISGTMRRTGLRLCWELDCPHMLYDSECKVNPADFDHTTTITALTATRMTVAALGPWPAARYAGGFFEWAPAGTTAGTKDRRGIESHMGGLQFAIFGSTDRLVVGQNITMYLGCDLTAATCKAVFNNLPNHGGFGFMPKKSPFDGTPVF